MLKQFSAYSPRVIHVKDLDGFHINNELCWTKRDVPGISGTVYAVQIKKHGDAEDTKAECINNITENNSCKQKLYTVAGFNISPDVLVILNADNIADALTISLMLYCPGQISLKEMLELRNITKNLGITLKSIDPQNRILKMPFKNTNDFEQLLDNVNKWPTVLTDYLSTKNIPYKTIELISNLKQNHREYIADFVAQTNPTLQQFRQFTDTTADFSDKISACKYLQDYHKEITFRLSIKHEKIDNILKNITEKAPSLVINGKDNFENQGLNITFSINSTKEYKKVLEYLEYIRNDIEELIKLTGEE